MTRRRPEWVVERIRKHHDRKGFSCGRIDLDEYLKRYARQNDEKGISHAYVAVHPGKRMVCGYFTISTCSIEFKELPESLAAGIPRYPVPCVLIGRLAVDTTSQASGLGRFLLMEALWRTLIASRDIAVYAVVVQAIDEKARRFYLHHGFDSLENDRLHMVLSMKAVRKLVE